MSENPVQKEERATTLDFTGVTVLGLPAGAGIVTINGNNNPAQTLNPGAGISITPGPPGTNTIANTAPGVPLTLTQSVAGVSPPIASGPPWTPTLCSLTGLSPGTYLFIAELMWGLCLANGDFGTSIQLNGTPIAEVDTVFVPPNIRPFGHSLSVVKAGIVALDTITLQGYQETGGPVSPVAGLTFLQAVKIG